MTPEFFERAAAPASSAPNIDVISLDEMHRRLIAGDFERRFVCLTFDDGYKDMLQWAYPLLKQCRCRSRSTSHQLSGPARRIVVARRSRR